MNLDSYQEELFKKFEEYRPKYSGPAYPPYHKGLYLEEYFCDDLLKFGKRTEKLYIPIFWTSCYLQNKTSGLQELLDTLDPELEYFCVSQHDDAVNEKLPLKTVHFNAGGNKNGIPIPLVCSPILNYQFDDKKTWCSFVGSVTHPIRQKLIQELHLENGFEFYCKHWSPSVEKEDEKFFLDKISESAFSLCPRGYGASSFRMYEAMQLGSVPVIIYDKPWFPYENFLEWDSFSVRVHESEISTIPERLNSLENKACEMSLRAQRTYKYYFALDKLPQNIYRILK